MRFLLTLTMICALFGVSYAQDMDTIYDVGRDKDGDTWFLDTSLIRRLDPPADWAILMPIYTKVKGGTIVFTFNVDCSDSTYQLTGSITLFDSNRKPVRTVKQTAWTKFFGYSGKAARITCRVTKGRPIPKLGSEVESR